MKTITTSLIHHHHHIINYNNNNNNNNNLISSQNINHIFKLQFPYSSLKFRSTTTRLPISSSSSKNKHTSSSSPLEKPELFDSQTVSDSDSPSTFTSSSTPFASFFHLFRDKFKFDELGMEIMSIALPATLALAADPITSLVDTAFVGHLGSAELAGVGVSISIFNLVAKLFNIPLLNITTSFVAEEQAISVNGDDVSTCVNNDGTAAHRKKLLPSVSTSLALATTFGILQTFALYFGSGFLLNTMEPKQGGASNRILSLTKK